MQTNRIDYQFGLAEWPRKPLSAWAMVDAKTPAEAVEWFIRGHAAGQESSTEIKPGPTVAQQMEEWSEARARWRIAGYCLEQAQRLADDLPEYASWWAEQAAERIAAGGDGLRRCYTI